MPETCPINDINVAITTMAREASNNIYSEPKFVAQVIRYTDNDVRRSQGKLITHRYILRSKVHAFLGCLLRGSPGTQPSRYRLRVIAASFALRRLTVDVGLLPLSAGSHALALFVFAPQSFAFALRRRALTFVRAPLPLVCRPLPLVRYSLTLVGDPISSPGLEFASLDVSLAVDDRIFALIELVGPPFQLGGRLDTILVGHTSP